MGPRLDATILNASAFLRMVLSADAADAAAAGSAMRLFGFSSSILHVSSDNS